MIEHTVSQKLKIDGAPRRIVTWLPMLRMVSRPVREGEDVGPLIAELELIVRQNHAYGISAIQIGEPLRVIVCAWIVGNKPQTFAFINPEITWISSEKTTMVEGCLSIPGTTKEIRRPRDIKVKAIGKLGVPIEFGATGISARAIQHEVDHLNGILIFDRSKHLSVVTRR